MQTHHKACRCASYNIFNAEEKCAQTAEKILVLFANELPSDQHQPGFSTTRVPPLRDGDVSAGLSPSREAAPPSAPCFTSPPSPDLRPTASVLSPRVNAPNSSRASDGRGRSFWKPFFSFRQASRPVCCAPRPAASCVRGPADRDKPTAMPGKPFPRRLKARDRSRAAIIASIPRRDMSLAHV